MRPYQLIILIVVSVFFSVLFANVAKIISTDAGLFRNFAKRKDKGHFTYEDNVMDDSTEELMWFIQISDIHISKFRDAERVNDLKEFCTQTIDAIRPSIVLASGDLTDAKSAYVTTSAQYEEEWQMYNGVLHDTGVLNKTKWIDIRGNHDIFNVPKLYSENDLFMKYSIQRHPRSYAEQLDVHGVRYTFLAVDACLDPGPKRQFNFMGVLTKNDTDEIQLMMEESKRQGAQHAVIFGHFPTSCILTPDYDGGGIRGLIGQYSEGHVYLSGHFHTLGNLVPRMYTLHHEGFLELELGDWMRNRLYRVAAFDHGLFSFVDIKHNTWPVILITNPKNALFNAPAKENPAIQRTSTHIRILAFSVSPIKQCKVKIDGEEWRECEQKTENLFVVKWDPTKYDAGLHSIKVAVTDENGLYRNVEQQFSLDGTRLAFDIMARLVLMGDLNRVGQCFFFTALAICILPLLFFRFRHIFGDGTAPTFVIMKTWCKKIWLLSTIDRFFYPIVGYCLYLLVGPWAFGEVIDGYFSVIFLWGILVNGALLPGTLNYFYGFLQLIVCEFTFINIFGSNVLRTFNAGNGEVSPVKRFVRVRRHIAFALIIMIELFLSAMFFYEYGTIAFLIAPMRFWAVGLNIYLYYQAINLPQDCLRSARVAWNFQPKSDIAKD